MNRYEVIKEEVYKLFDNYATQTEQKWCLEHLFNVVAIIELLAIKRSLNCEIAAIIGILHDIAKIKYHSSFDHANRSSQIARQLLSDQTLFTQDEILMIVTAIKNHSNKEKIDDVYSELIKDADLLAQYLKEPDAIFNEIKNKRLQKTLGSLL